MGCLWFPRRDIGVSVETVGRLLAEATLGVDERTLGETVVTHADAHNEVSISTVRQVLARCRLADAQPMLVAKSVPSSGDSAWRDHVDLSMLVNLQSA